MRYIFRRIETVEDILKAINRPDILSTTVSISRPAFDEATGEVIGDIAIDFGSNLLSIGDVERLGALMKTIGMMKVQERGRRL